MPPKFETFKLVEGEVMYLSGATLNALAAQDEELVKLVGKLRKTSYAPRIAEIRKTFLRIRKKYRRFWK